MPDYQKGKIYRIISPSKNLVYIGSTTQPLSQRLAGHIRDYKKYNDDNNNANITSYILLECEDYKIELLEDYPCNNKQQLERKEGEYIKNNECVNRCVAGRTLHEWYVDNIKKIKQYRIANADKYKEYGKQWIINNADKVKQYRIANADKIKVSAKQWKINNADKVKEYNRQYKLKKKLEKQSFSTE